MTANDTTAAKLSDATNSLYTPRIQSRLPNMGTTIFSVMSALAQEKGAVNLGQGFPDFDCAPPLVEAVEAAMRAGHNQYPLMTGVPALRNAIAAKIAALYQYQYHANTEITITAGATQAILTAILCCVHQGDEVIVIEPAYDSYVAAIQMAGGKAVSVQMEVGEQGYYVPWQQVANAMNSKTRMLIINSPHNPTGSILRAADMQNLREILQGTEVILLSDEVYEHMVYDGQQHESVCRYPDLAARAFVVSSFGKTYHVTGWKIGYVAAPAELMAEFRKVHQYNVFTVNTPMQHGLANFMSDSAPYLQLPQFYQHKRDLFRAGLAKTRFELLPSDGTYFQCVRYTKISDILEQDFAKWLTSEIGVAAIPVSAFYQQPKESSIVRFCFAKQDQTLLRALELLAKA